MSKKRKFLIRSIISNIGNCLIADRIIIMNTLSLRVGSDNIFEEGTGCRIFFKLISTSLLIEIDELVQEMKKATAIDLSDVKIPSWELE